MEKLSKGAWRWLNIGLRTVHVGVASVVAGGVVLHVDHARTAVWTALTVVAGAGLVALEIRHDRNWAHRGKGLLCMAHIVFALLLAFPSFQVLAMPMAVACGCVGSHMPRAYRHWSMLHGPEPGGGGNGETC